MNPRSATLTRPTGRYRGFSLRDLLITLVMLVAVLALLLPTLRDVQRTENATACQVNLRENGLATLAYSQDNKGLFPRFGFDLSTDDQGQLEVDVVLRAASASGIDQYQTDNLICPSDRDQGYLCVGKDQQSAKKIAVGYGYNISLIQRPLTVPELDSPARTAVLYDGTIAGACGKEGKLGGLYRDAYAFAQHALVARHEGQISLVYADWHTVTVEALPRAAIELPENPNINQIE